jgi:hypothetical protein
MKKEWLEANRKRMEKNAEKRMRGINKECWVCRRVEGKEYPFVFGNGAVHNLVFHYYESDYGYKFICDVCKGIIEDISGGER